MERYVDSEHRFALMRAWCGCMEIAPGADLMKMHSFQL